MCKTKFYWRQALAVVIASLVSLDRGLLQAWTSPFMLKIARGQEYTQITLTETSYFPMIGPLVMALTAVLSYKICEKYGRKKALLFSALPSSIAWIIQAFAEDINAFYTARFIAGISDAYMYSVLPVYVGEVTDPKVRGPLGSILTCSNYLGMLIMNVIGSHLSNKMASLICLIVPCVFFISFAFMPESPYFYLSHNRDTEAKKSLKWLLHKDNIDHEYTQLKSDVQRQISETGTWQELLTLSGNRRALFSGIIMRIAQQLAGISAFEWYTQLMFAKSGSMFSAEVSAQIYMGMCFVVFSTAALFVCVLKRRVSFISSLFLCSIVLFAESFYFYIDENKPKVNLDSFKWFPITGMVLYVIFASYGVMLLPTLMVGELFSVSIKAKAAALLVTFYGVGEMIINYIFYYMQDRYGLYAPFSLFACCSVFFGVLTYFILPETKDKTLEQIQTSMKKQFLNDNLRESVKYEHRLREQVDFLLPAVPNVAYI